MSKKKQPAKKKLIDPVRSLSHLRQLAASPDAATADAYTKLTMVAARNLGGRVACYLDAMRWLETNAMEVDEESLYSLFELQDDRWVRISTLAYPKATAVRVFQDRLLAPYLGTEVTRGKRELRPVRGGAQ